MNEQEVHRLQQKIHALCEPFLSIPCGTFSSAHHPLEKEIFKLLQEFSKKDRNYHE